jgi:hypothetical protein
MNFSQLKKLYIPDGSVQSIKTPNNMVPLSIDTDGSIFNGCGYLNGYRLNSSGGLTDVRNNLYYKHTVTGFIPVFNKETVYIENCPWYNINSAVNYICAYDSNFNFIGAEFSSGLFVTDGYHYGTKFVDTSGGNIRKCVIKLLENSNISYIRVSVGGKYIGELVSGDSIFVGVLSNCYTLWEAVTYKNWVKYSTESDGVTIYNGGLGYKDDYRIRSGGAEAEAWGAAITGFIPLKRGETLRIYPAFTGLNTQNTINFFDSSFTNLGQITDGGVGYGICNGKENLYKSTVIDGVSKLTLTDAHDSAIAYVRIGNGIAVDYGSPIKTGAAMIVTVNEEIV